MDYYGATKKQARFIEKTPRIVKDAVYVLDSRIVPRAMALKEGRRFYAQGSSKGCFFVSTLSEANTDVVGSVKSMADNHLTLVIDHGTDKEELALAVAPNAVIRGGGETALQEGVKVRVAYARPQTVDVLTVESRKGLVAQSIPKAMDGIVTHAEGKKFTVSDPSGGSWTAVEYEDRRPVRVTATQSRFKEGDAIAAGMRLCFIGYWKRPKKMDKFALALGADEGRREGIVKAAAAGSITLTGSDGKEATATLADATVLIDGKPGDAAAIPVGSHAFIFAPRRQTIEVLPE
jgi:hypothetical protein